MAEQITITVSDEVYRGLQSMAGERTLGEVIEDMARPIVAENTLAASYEAMSLDVDREMEALEWSEGLIADSYQSDDHASR